MTASRRRGLRLDDPVGPAATPGPTVDFLAAVPPGRLQELSLERIRPNADQPRKHLDESALTALSDAIRERGVLQPIIVQLRPGDGYQLITGERRWRASRLAGQAAVPALIDRIPGTAASLEVALIENVAREDLTVIEPSGIASDASFGRFE